MSLTRLPSPFANSTTKDKPAIIHTNPASQHVQDIFLDRFEKKIIRTAAVAVRKDCENIVAALCSDEVNTNKKSKQDITRQQKRLLQQRLLIGTNECTRALLLPYPDPLMSDTGLSTRIPELVVLCLPYEPPKVKQKKKKNKIKLMNEPFRSKNADHTIVSDTKKLPVDVTPWTHIPILAHQKKVSLLWLGGQGADCVIGRLLGCKRATVIAFVDAKHPIVKEKVKRMKEPLKSACSLSTNENEMAKEMVFHAQVNSFLGFVLSKLVAKTVVT